MPTERLEQQLRFILEVDKLKTVLRRTYVADGSRRENSAEHSWQLALMATLLAEYANEPIDVARAVAMCVVHDIVEVDAGDTFAYDTEAERDKAERETRAADRLFEMLPVEQGAELRQLWDDFEAMESPEARFAAALDRLMPLMLNYYTGGASWQQHHVTSDRVRVRNAPARKGSEILWEYGEALIDRAVAEGLLAEGP